MREGELTLDRVDEPDALEALVDEVFADPVVRRGMGWTEADDPDEALEAIHGLWQHRLEASWQLFDVRRADRRIGLAGLGPIDPDTGGAWYAIYLLERGQGLGSHLTEILARRARKAGAEELVAVSWAENDAIRGLLASTGFELVGEAPYDWARESQLTWVEYRRGLDEAP